jgi:hypothetical protein
MAVVTWTGRRSRAGRRHALRAVLVPLIALFAAFESPGGVVLPSCVAFVGCFLVSLSRGRRRALWLGVFGFAVCVILRFMVQSVAGANVA